MKEKQLVKAWLKELGLPQLKLAARTVNSPFGGAPRLFVKVHDWVPDPRAIDLEVRASVHGFSVAFDSGVYCSHEDEATRTRKREIRKAYMATLTKEEP